jgi:NAD(P)-dependent dehydrogenase (short-subunit alcohol dehydrogenase family)
MDLEAQGQVALVVGAASGMGRLAAQRWARAGGIAVAADVNEAGLRETADGHTGIHVRPVDVTRPEAVTALVKEIETDIGPLDRVYNGAGVMPTSLLLEQDLDEIHRIMDVNYGGTVNVSLAALPPMLARGRGALINFASIAGWVPNMHFGAYSASKFAVVAFSEVLHHENRDKGVTICCVCPATVDTPLLAQATSKPRIMETGPKPIPPERVLDAIDRAVARREFWVFAGLTTRLGWYFRRFVPGLMWKIGHNAEGF